MDNTREKLLDLLCQGREMANQLCGEQDSCEKCPYQAPKGCAFGIIADHLIANGVTLKTTKVKPKKKPVKKEISQETLNALATMGRKVHGEV